MEVDRLPNEIFESDDPTLYESLDDPSFDSLELSEFVCPQMGVCPDGKAAL